MKVCKFCKEEFEAQYLKQHFCSQYCAQQSIFAKAFFSDKCLNCDGQGLEPDYVGLEMRCVGVRCSDCGGSGVKSPDLPKREETK